MITETISIDNDVGNLITVLADNNIEPETIDKQIEILIKDIY